MFDSIDDKQYLMINRTTNFGWVGLSDFCSNWFETGRSPSKLTILNDNSNNTGKIKMID